MILVLGSGSVGSFYGGLLAANAQKVILVGRSFHIEVVRSNGLKIEGLFDFHIQPYLAGTFDILYPTLEEICEDINYILVTTKAHQTQSALEEILPIVSKKTVFICIQNGIGTEDIVKELYPENSVLRAITSIGVNRPKDGKIEFVSEGSISVGNIDENDAEKAKEFVNILIDAGLDAEYTNNIQGAVYTKAIINCALNPLTALFNVKNKEIINQNDLKEKAILIATEAWNVVKKLDIELTVKDPIEYMLEVIEKTGENTNSMLKDVLNKHKTEIEFINGKIILLGEKHGVDVNNNKEVYDKIISLEQSFL